MLPPLLSWPTETQHPTWLPSMHCSFWWFPKVSVVEQKREGGTSGCEGRNANSNCSVSNVSISLNTPFCEMQSSPFRLESYLLLLRRKQVWLTVLFGCLVHVVLTNSRSNRSSVSPRLSQRYTKALLQDQVAESSPKLSQGHKATFFDPTKY